MKQLRIHASPPADDGWRKYTFTLENFTKGVARANQAGRRDCDAKGLAVTTFCHTAMPASGYRLQQIQAWATSIPPSGTKP